MPGILRFLLYTDANRQTFTQIRPDVPVDEMPRFGFGRKLRVPDDQRAPMDLPVYVVAKKITPRQEPDPHQPSFLQTVYEVFLTRVEDWTQLELSSDSPTSPSGALQRM